MDNEVRFAFGAGWPDWTNFRLLGDFFISPFFYYISWPNFSVALFHMKSYVLVMPENGFGYILGDVVTNSSGHPGSELR
jgi:hypothetical protein